MVQMKVKYVGEKHCVLEHGPSKSEIETDAPKDNHGRGERFSPTDLVGAALGSCILTTMAIVSEKEGFTLGEARCEVEKEMTPPPRKIASLKTTIFLSSKLTDEQRSKMEFTAKNCPVTLSLNPNVSIPLKFIYEH